jgi:hypothetical protein
LQLDVTDQKAPALLALLNRRSRMIGTFCRVLRGIRAKLTGAPPEPPLWSATTIGECLFAELSPLGSAHHYIDLRSWHTRGR